MVDSLNSRGIRRRDGGRWIPQQVTRLLNNPRNAGLRELHGVVYEGTWERIFSTEEWEALQHVIRRRKEQSLRAPTSRRYLLTGLLKCGKCVRSSTA
ncbi:recombinase family protein [Microbacteriaceae bacterium VKM Ac-2855]|nr:recombinase family protein [Microbacteriaceae bacterium VKM Ac-2855]